MSGGSVEPWSVAVLTRGAWPRFALPGIGGGRGKEAKMDRPLTNEGPLTSCSTPAILGTEEKGRWLRSACENSVDDVE